MLVLAIMASFILFGINQYQQFKTEASFMDIKQNVDVLFQAMGRYYQANCRNLSDSAVAIALGKTPTDAQGDLAPGLSATITPAIDYSTPNVNYSIDIKTKLLAYLPNTWPTFIPQVDTSDGFNGYTTSFLFLQTTRNAYECWSFPDSKGNVTTQCGDSQPIQPNKTAFWLALVAVKIANDPTGDKTKALLGATGASCASGVATSCDGSKTPNYLIWQQLPTKSGSNINSDLWISQAQEVMFNQQYTHDAMYELATPNYTKSDSSLDDYYLCGN